MIKIKNLIFFVVSIAVIVIVLFNAPKIAKELKNFFSDTREVEIKDSNEYKYNTQFKFVSESEDFIPNNYQDLVNIFYTVLNNGWDEFTFYCPRSYANCIDDVSKLSNDNDLLSNINDFIHPYNSYSTIRTLYDDTGEITLRIQHLYSSNEIAKIDRDIDRIIKEQTNNNMSDYDKIMALHDYIVDNTKYDSERAKNQTSAYDSARIQGVLYDHYAICSGYADTMAVVLTKLGITNYKISSAKHVWNAVYLDGKWYHLDVTFDDPVTTTGKDLLEHNYFLVDNDEFALQDIDSPSNRENHTFDKTIYIEFDY